MTLIVTDPREQEMLIAQRRESGADRFDEVWEGTYVMAPIADDEHQDLQSKFIGVFLTVVGWSGEGLVRGGVNVTDRKEDWKFNFRCPDVVVFMKNTSARNRRSHWFGGPDFAVEILSPGDRTPEKLPFYGSVGVRELLVIGRDPWSIELYRLRKRKLVSIGRLTSGSKEILESEVLPLRFRLMSGKRPAIEISHPQSGQKWLI